MIDDTPITRRNLIAFGGTALAAASVPGLALPVRASAATDWLARSTYASRIGETFYMRVAGGGRAGMRLEAVTGDEKCFDLVFAPATSTVHEQATREIRHPKLGSTMLFVVPLKTPQTDLRFIVSVNRSH